MPRFSRVGLKYLSSGRFGGEGGEVPCFGNATVPYPALPQAIDKKAEYPMTHDQ
jgi:hypothetical protein